MMHQVLITVNESPVDAGQVLSTRLTMIQAGNKNDLYLMHVYVYTCRAISQYKSAGHKRSHTTRCAWRKTIENCKYTSQPANECSAGFGGWWL